MRKSVKRLISMALCLAMLAMTLCVPVYAVDSVDVHDMHDCSEHEIPLAHVAANVSIAPLNDGTCSGHVVAEQFVATGSVNTTTHKYGNNLSCTLTTTQVFYRQYCTKCGLALGVYWIFVDTHSATHS